jgi:hypothetical protein
LVGGKELFSLSGAVECKTYCDVRITGQWTIISVILIFCKITATYLARIRVVSYTNLDRE